MDRVTTALAVPTHAYQLGLFENNGALEAAALHVKKTGFFSVCFSNAATIKEAERQNYLFYDLKDYETRSESWGELRAKNSGYSSRSERMEQLETQLDKRARFALRQRSYHVSAMRTVIAQIFKRSDFAESDFYITQNTFFERNRRATNLLHLNALYFDIDIDKSGHWSKKLTPHQQGEAFSDWCKDNNIPLSIILHSGRGLHCKIWFETSVSAMAKPIWDAMEKSLIFKIKEGGWPVDEAVCDVSRILRINETYNQKNGSRVDVVWVNGTKIEDAKRFDFNWLADSRAILPFTRAEVHQFKKEREFWSENNAKALADGIKTNYIKQLNDLTASQLWHFRMEVITRFVNEKYPNGVPDGSRNNFAFMAALALAWSCGQYDDYMRDLVNVILQICPSLSNSEILSLTSSVSKRAKDKNLYKYKNEKFYSTLGIPSDFVDKVRVAHGMGKNRSNINFGAMGFEKLANLPYEEWTEQVTERRVAAASRTNDIKIGKYSEQRKLAAEYKRQGITQTQIALNLGLSQSTISKWWQKL